MITPQQMAEGFALNLRIIQMQTEGLTHEDSLAKTQYKINSLNWVLGHIAVNRDNLLRLLNVEPLMDEHQASRYQRGSEPVSGASEDTLRLDELLDILRRGQEKISVGLTSLRSCCIPCGVLPLHPIDR